MSRPRVAIIGGGLAGLSAATSLVGGNCDVQLFESRRQLGGRAVSFRDPATGILVDFCQHVSMGCCTELARFCQTTGIDREFARYRTLYFVGADGRVSKVTGNRLLPPPLHLAPSLLRMKFLPLVDRLRVARGLLALRGARAEETDMLSWLRAHGQSAVAIERFWSVVLVSALGDTLDRVSLSAARKVFVDGFMTRRDGYEVLIPRQPLSELFDVRVRKYLSDRGVVISCGSAVKQVELIENQLTVQVGDAPGEPFDAVVGTVAWRQAGDLWGPVLRARLGFVDAVRNFQSSPITGVHLWFDRPITRLPHAVLVDRLSQWLFGRGEQVLESGDQAHYYQVVISASRMLAGRARDEVVRQVVDDLASIWPAVRDARLLQSKVVTEQHAVFTPTPGLNPLRPDQQTPIAGLYLAGDWTATGWPATMEGAVRSGQLAAELVRRQFPPEVHPPFGTPENAEFREFGAAKLPGRKVR
jgi:squalene-associated FAD-dependent desaturase